MARTLDTYAHVPPGMQTAAAEEAIFGGHGDQVGVGFGHCQRVRDRSLTV